MLRTIWAGINMKNMFKKWVQYYVQKILTDFYSKCKCSYIYSATCTHPMKVPMTVFSSSWNSIYVCGRNKRKKGHCVGSQTHQKHHIVWDVSINLKGYNVKEITSQYFSFFLVMLVNLFSFMKLGHDDNSANVLAFTGCHKLPCSNLIELL